MIRRSGQLWSISPEHRERIDDPSFYVLLRSDEKYASPTWYVLYGDRVCRWEEHTMEDDDLLVDPTEGDDCV